MVARGSINPFSGIAAEPALWQMDLAQPEPKQRLVIYFTPRSSSTRITEILSRTGRLGLANEAFNPTHMAVTAKRWQVADMETYIALLLRRQARGEVYSCEVTAHHLYALFADESLFTRAFAMAPSVWLIRQDIVAQAVSLAKMVGSNVGHSPFSSPEALEQSDAKFSYDAKVIRYWLAHIRAAEVAQEAFFARHQIAPLRISYEQVTALDEARVLALFASHLQIPLPALPPAGDSQRHRKIGTARNDDFAARFRADAAAELAQLERERAFLIAQLHDLDLEIPSATALRKQLSRTSFVDHLLQRLVEALAPHPATAGLAQRLQSHFVRRRQRVSKSRA